jgi:hypothetical protein
MFSLVRSGPKMLLLESPDIESLRNYLINHLGAEEYALNSAFEKTGEDSTILFLTEEMKDIINEKDILDTLVIAEEPDVVLCQLINDKNMVHLKRVRIAPRIIMLRAMGEMEKVIQEIHNDHGGSFGPLMEILNSGNEKGTLVAVTDKPLNHNIGVNDLYPKCLFVEQGFYPLFKNLRLHALKYLNKGIDNKDWFEIEIRIYDRYSAYKLHYQRLADILDFLELGIILGESWGKDYPRFMMAIGVYRLRFFTFHDPKYIKKMLVGLEYVDDGTRIVDYDVYYKHKKIDWTDTLYKEDPRVRHLLGLKYRENIFTRLNKQETELLKYQEEQILKTRC